MNIKSNDISLTKDVDKKKFDLLNTLGVLPILILFVILFYAIEPRFGTINNITNIFRQASVNIIIACGMTMVILTAGIDLSVGSVLAVTAVVAVKVSLTTTPWLAIPVALLVGLVIGAVNGLLISVFKMPPFIATLGTMTSFRGVAYLVADGTTVINNDLPYEAIGNGRFMGYFPWMILIALVIFAIVWILLKRTVLGTRIYAVGGNELAAKYSGISVGVILVIVYALSGLLSGIAGVVLSARLFSASGLLGISYELDAIAAVILGGTSFNGGIGGVGGTLIGALIIAVLNNGLIIAGVPYFWQQVVKGIVIVAAVLIDIYRQKMKK